MAPEHQKLEQLRWFGRWNKYAKQHELTNVHKKTFYGSKVQSSSSHEIDFTFISNLWNQKLEHTFPDNCDRRVTELCKAAGMQGKPHNGTCVAVQENKT